MIDKLSSIILNLNFYKETKKINMYIAICCAYMILTKPFPFVSANFPQFFSSEPIGIFKLLSKPIPNEYLQFVRYLWIPTLLSFAILRYKNFLSKLIFILATIVYGYGLNFTPVFHGNHILVMALGILAITNLTSSNDFIFCNPLTLKQGTSLIKSYVVYTWTLLGLQKIFASGFLWVFSPNMANKAFLTPGVTPFSQILADTAPDLFIIIALFGLLIELFSPLALFFTRGAYLFPIIWSSFHVMVTIMFGGHFSFYSQIPVYAIFWLNPQPVFNLSFHGARSFYNPQ